MSLSAGGWRSRSTSWPWRSDTGSTSRLRMRELTRRNSPHISPGGVVATTPGYAMTMTVDIPQGAQARKVWRALGPWMRVRLALRALRGREAYCDVRVAAAAVGWARLTLATPKRQFLVPGWLGLLAAFVLVFVASQLFGLNPFH
jgi:hypothetical protein